MSPLKIYINKKKLLVAKNNFKIKNRKLTNGESNYLCLLDNV